MKGDRGVIRCNMPGCRKPATRVIVMTVADDEGESQREPVNLCTGHAIWLASPEPATT